MEISGLFTAILAGLVIGALGRLVVPGKQHIPLWLTMVVGLVAALLGTFVARLLGVSHTAGVDWIQLFLQIGFAAFGVTLVSRSRQRGN